jgi:hypothetical protein
MELFTQHRLTCINYRVIILVLQNYRHYQSYQKEKRDALKAYVRTLLETQELPKKDESDAPTVDHDQESHRTIAKVSSKK